MHSSNSVRHHISRPMIERTNFLLVSVAYEAVSLDHILLLFQTIFTEESLKRRRVSDIQLTNVERKLFQDIRSVVADLKLGTVVRVAGDNLTY